MQIQPVQALTLGQAVGAVQSRLCLYCSTFCPRRSPFLALAFGFPLLFLSRRRLAFPFSHFSLTFPPLSSILFIGQPFLSKAGRRSTLRRRASIFDTTKRDRNLGGCDKALRRPKKREAWRWSSLFVDTGLDGGRLSGPTFQFLPGVAAPVLRVGAADPFAQMAVCLRLAAAYGDHLCFRQFVPRWRMAQIGHRPFAAFRL